MAHSTKALVLASSAAAAPAHGAAATPQQARGVIVSNATTGVVHSTGSGSPNLLLYTANFL